MEQAHLDFLSFQLPDWNSATWEEMRDAEEAFLRIDRSIANASNMNRSFTVSQTMCGPPVQLYYWRSSTRHINMLSLLLSAFRPNSKLAARNTIGL